MSKGYEDDPRRMSFLEHLGELRMVLIHVAIIVLVGLAGAWLFSGRLLDFLIVRLGLENVQFISPMEPFNARFKVALIVGLMAGMPVIAFRVWAFVVPALHRSERRIVVPSALATSFLFAAGTAFAILVLTPLMLKLLVGFGTEHAEAHLALGPVLAFVLRMSLACALLFQLPLVLAITSMIGLTSPRMLMGKWRHAIVLMFVLAAIVTPGDGPSQVVLAAPLVLLYFVSVLVSWLIWRARGRHAAERRRSASDAGAPPGDPGAPDGSRAPSGSPSGPSGSSRVPADDSAPGTRPPDRDPRRPRALTPLGAERPPVSPEDADNGERRTTPPKGTLGRGRLEPDARGASTPEGAPGDVDPHEGDPDDRP